METKHSSHSKTISKTIENLKKIRKELREELPLWKISIKSSKKSIKQCVFDRKGYPNPLMEVTISAAPFSIPQKYIQSYNIKPNAKRLHLYVVANKKMNYFSQENEFSRGFLKLIDILTGNLSTGTIYTGIKNENIEFYITKDFKVTNELQETMKLV